MFYKKQTYPDGTFYPILNSFPEEFTFRINNYSDLWLLKQIKDVYNHNNLNAVVKISNLLDAQADRRFNLNESANLKLVAKELNNMSWEKVKIFHPHNPEVVEALIDNVEIISNVDFIAEVIKNITNPKGIAYNRLNVPENIYDNLILMSSDAGGFKPLMKLCDKIQWKGETFSASKSRKFENGESKLIQIVDREDFNGKDILIIDDICVYGGTFKGLSKLLKERNCGKLYLAVSHMTIYNLGEDPVTNYFDEVFTTNSKYNNYIYKTLDINHGLLDTLSQPKNLEIIKLF